MKFSAAVAALSLGGVEAFFAQNDYSVGAPLGPAMWVMGDNGLAIYSADGSTLLKNTPAIDICHEVASSYKDPTGPKSLTCSWSDVVSDGKKYVWAAVSRGSMVLDVFSLDTGDLVATTETCNRVFDLDFHAGRDEMFVRCMSPNPDDPEIVGHVESFSTTSFASSRRAIQLNNRSETETAYGHIVADGTLGDSAYTTITNLGAVIELDLSSNEAVKEWTIPGMSGAYDIEFSRVNKHLFFHARVCCTCGFPGADKESCGRYSPDNVTVTIGPSAKPGVLQQGRCGTTCSGSEADVLGVVEFDTQTNSVVGNHFSKNGFGARARVSPNGDLIFLLEDNALDNNMRILRAGKNGKPSTVAYDIPLGFNHTMRDFLLIEDADRKIVIMASNEQNVLHMANLNEVNPKVHSFTFKEGENTGNRRQLEWAEGTDYAWISGRASDDVAMHETYVIEIPGNNLEETKVVKTLKGVSASKMKYVINFEREQLQEEFSVAQISSATRGVEVTSSDSDSTSTVAIIALIAGVAALLVGIANLVLVRAKIDPVAASPLVVNAATRPTNGVGKDTDSELGGQSLDSVA
eukprot:CAMPEP_0198140926 /NCGR_PEP_ID=MMETSP1443-20131203/4010_1 /TAXON_ID=186043 /ORGANISM="Entomoneis sp., Strain CCMP2396" /LENGTH=576 /DNA_ID=CAMNT_0043803503 /DNA_START=78 /DNA_END=1808 /DNA_ORIENTATION=+